MRTWVGIVVAATVVEVWGAAGASAQVAIDEAKKLTVSGDFRLRLEQDWDSRTAAGAPRADRLRMRARARAGLGYALTDTLSLGLNIASGADGSHQSPHVTLVDFDDNDTGDADFNFSKWFLRAKLGKHFEGTAGRDSLTAWRPNEMFWDDDVTAAGIGLRYRAPVGGAGASFTLNGGYYSLPVGMRTFSGNLGLGQAVYAFDRPNGFGLTAATGAFLFDANPADPNAAGLRLGNGTRDYSIWVTNLQLRGKLAGRQLTFGADYMSNGEDYASGDPDPFTRANREETTGYDAYVTWGGTGERGDWLFGVWYAHIETFAVNASYAQDDWVRWGSATQIDSSDLEGFELRAAVGLGQKQNLMLRVYLVEAITSQQDGNRARLDYNVSF